MPSCCAADRDLAWLADRFGEAGMRAEVDRWITSGECGYQRLWDQDRGMFASLDLNTGELVPATTSAGFLALYGGAASAEQAGVLVERFDHWLGRAPFGLPTVALDESVVRQPPLLARPDLVDRQFPDRPRGLRITVMAVGRRNWRHAQPRRSPRPVSTRPSIPPPAAAPAVPSFPGPRRCGWHGCMTGRRRNRARRSVRSYRSCMVTAVPAKSWRA